jgi:hypothetical protein
MRGRSKSAETSSGVRERGQRTVSSSNTLNRELVGQTLALDELKKRGRCYRTLIKDDD